MPAIKELIQKRMAAELQGAKKGAKTQEAIERALPSTIGSGFIPDLPSENNTVLTQANNYSIDSDAEKAVFLVMLMNFALGGKESRKRIAGIKPRLYMLKLIPRKLGLVLGTILDIFIVSFNVNI